MIQQAPLGWSLIRLSLLVCVATSLAFGQKPVVRIGVALDGPSEFSEKVSATFEHEVSIILQDSYDVRFPSEKRLTADWTLPGVERILSSLLGDEDVDMVLALGFISSDFACRLSLIPKPVFAPYVGEASVQGIPERTLVRPMPPPEASQEYTVSGIKNLSYLEFGGSLRDDIRQFREVVQFSRLVMLLMESWAESLPNTAEIADNLALELGLGRVYIASALPTVESMLNAIPADADAVYVPPFPSLSDSDKARFLDELKSRRLPSFSSWGRRDVELGALTGLRTEEQTLRRARRTAMLMEEVLGGAEPGEMPTQFSREERLIINMATARAIGVSPRFTTLIKADLLNEELTQAARTLSLSMVVREASTANLDLVAADRAVAAGEAQVREARAPLLPQIGLSGDVKFRDKNLVEVAPFLFGEREYRGGVGFSQSIYNDEFWAGYEIEKSLQDSRQEERAQLRLDVILEASESYLSLLREKTVERIQKANLELTRANLELARARVQIGTAGREELFRWEDQIATNQKVVVESEASRRQAELNVNRILNQPLEERFLTTEATLKDPELVASFEALGPFIESPAGLALFSNFMVNEAFEASPELRQYEALIRAQGREAAASKRSFFIPNFFLQGGVQWFDRTRPEGIDFPELNNTWEISLNATLPLFEGAGRWARVSKAENQLNELTLRQEATRQRVEQRLRSIIERANASFIGIELAKISAEAASRNLDLITERYAQGVVDILVLLDAQNRSLSADLDAANAIYTYLIDLMGVQRAVGKFDYFRSPQERQEFLSQLETFYRDQGYEIWTP